jgi:hypothetical protein
MKYQEEVDDLRFTVIDGKALAGELYGRLVVELDRPGVSVKEKQLVGSKYQELQNTLTRIIKLINSNMRGMNNAKSETLEIKIEELLDLLPAERRQPFLEAMLEKEGNIDANTLQRQ